MDYSAKNTTHDHAIHEKKFIVECLSVSVM